MSAVSKPLIERSRRYAEVVAVHRRWGYRLGAVVTPGAAPEVEVEGRRCLSFSSNDYLGLATHPAVRRAAREAIAELGLGVASSPALSGTLQATRDIEQLLASRLFPDHPPGRHDAVLFESGYAANTAVSCLLAEPDCLAYSDEEIHASLVEGLRGSRATVRIFPHNDVDALARLLEADGAAPSAIFAESVYSMSGTFAPLPELCALAREHRALLWVDEAHGFAVCGENGLGGAELLGVLGRADCVLVTFSKALGGSGAAVVGPGPVVERLRFWSRPQVYSTAPCTAAVHGAREALRIALGEEGGALRAQLARNRSYFADALSSLYPGRIGQTLTPIIPFRVWSAPLLGQVQQRLLECGIWLAAVPGASRASPLGGILRITLTARHDRAHLDRLLTALDELGSLLARDTRPKAA